MSDPSDVPAVVVERAPDGWTHIGGPGMHLLIGLDEEDDRTIAASDAADGGDLDDVIEVLTAGGMRKAHHFVGVHWQPRTRVVAFGPVSALVTLGDGSAHDVRATSNRVWTDLELPEHPERVVLRVLEESERSQPQPPQTLAPDAAAAPVAPAAETAAPASASPERPAEAPEPPTDASERSVAASASSAVISAVISAVTSAVTPAVTEPSKSSPWDRRWATPDPAAAPQPPAAGSLPQHVVEQPPGPASAPAAAPGALRSWTSVRPSAPSRTGQAAPAADDLPPAAQSDLDSTWSARPVLEPEPAGAPRSTDPYPTGEEPEPAAPSYDYLFGHTTAADEHRRVLAELTRSDDDDEEPAGDEVLSVPSVADTSEAPVTNLPPEPEVPAPPVPAVQDLPAATEGGLISSVPWASPAPAPEVPKPEPAAPTFSGRHTPPPPPSLLPPMNTPPPGVRAPEATPLISTGPPPVPPAPATTGAPGTPAGGRAYPAVSQPLTEPTFEVPIAPRPATAPAVPTPPARPTPPAVPTPQIDVADDDDAELTVDRSALLEARNAAQGQGFSGPSVLAVLCSAGHPTPPHGDRCRVCGAGIPPQGPFTMPRPPLGVLRLSTGDVVTLDRSVLLGRAPKLGEGVAAHDRPHVVKVPSPERDISRNHVEVILEGWHVLIRDLGTTNGTTVTLPGESPVRLRANDQQVLEPGSFVSMADEVTFTFETTI